MIYADYAYYTANYFGSVIPQDAYDAVAMRASRFLDYYTMNRAKDHADREEVKMACCALAEEYHTIFTAQKLTQQAAETTGEMQSQTVGSYSVTYRSAGDAAKTMAELSAQAQSRLAAVARQYLAYTGLLYRGGGCGCTHRTL